MTVTNPLVITVLGPMMVVEPSNPRPPNPRPKPYPNPNPNPYPN